MPELRKDIVKDAWVIIATEQALNPHDFPINKNGVHIGGSSLSCPFCAGNEALTTPEIAAVRNNNSRPNTPGWTVRVVSSKYSAFKLEGELSINDSEFYSTCNGLGQQEVIIGSPEHEVEFHNLPVDRIELVYRMLQQRYRALSADSRVKYIQIYKNKGLFAGASQEHSHTQLLALPMPPDNQQGLLTYFEQKKQCLLCVLMESEREENKRLVFESEYFFLFCPFASRFSYETWIIPKRHTEHFAEITEPEIKDLALTIKKFFNVMITLLNDPAYNIVINTAPVNVPYKEGHHWWLEINPRFLVRNGLEISSGYYINPVAPELAAALLREKINKE